MIFLISTCELQTIILFFCFRLLHFLGGGSGHGGPWRLPTGMAGAFQKLVNNYNTVIVQLGSHFHNQREVQSRLFNFTIKNHILEHIASESAHLNPTLVWGYPSEDFLMKVGKLVQSSCHGASPLKTQANVMKKYVHGLGMSLLPEHQVLVWGYVMLEKWLPWAVPAHTHQRDHDTLESHLLWMGNALR